MVDFSCLFLFCSFVECEKDNVEEKKYILEFVEKGQRGKVESCDLATNFYVSFIPLAG